MPATPPTQSICRPKRLLDATYAQLDDPGSDRPQLPHTTHVPRKVSRMRMECLGRLRFMSRTVVVFRTALLFDYAQLAVWLQAGHLDFANVGDAMLSKMALQLFE